jgi:hypothetical protein
MSVKNRIQNDYVMGLTTGQKKDYVDANGRVSKKFVPNIINKYAPLNNVLQNNVDKNKNSILVKESLILPPFVIERGEWGNIREFQKTPYEKEQLKQIKKDHKDMLKKAGMDTKKRLNLSSPMVVSI